MKNIVETAMEAGTFKTLVEAVKTAGLVKTLSGKGPFTVFAPNDAAQRSQRQTSNAPTELSTLLTEYISASFDSDYYFIIYLSHIHDFSCRWNGECM